MPTTVKTIGETVLNTGSSAFIKETFVSAPFTTIQNRAKVSASLKAVFGNERIHVNSLNKLTKEFGPNGESVYEPDNGDARIRFVGGWSCVFNTNGQRAQTSLVNSDFVEVTFYGTGLNAICNTGSGTSFQYSVDGIGSTAVSLAGSSVLNTRNLKTNNIVPVVSGLSLDWHTVKITTTASNLDVYGFEIINEASQITVMPGEAYSDGEKYEISSPQLLDYRLGFENVLDINVGAKGGRSVIYLDTADSLIKKRLTKTDTSAAYLNSTDHSNETIWRKINFREFGRNRGDDFSTLNNTVSDRAFTLDDGTTTLVGNDVRVYTGGTFASYPGVYVNGSGAAGGMVLTFVGTGLDWIMNFGSQAETITIYIDGVSVGTIPYENLVKNKKVSVCSGLPYGTHTVRLERGGGFSDFCNVSDFIIYQPKKPTLPDGAIEIAEYNIMADFVPNTVSGVETISTGVMRKDKTRELRYTGAWGFGTYSSQTIKPDKFIGGFNIYTNTASDYAEFTFFGTGFDYRYFAQNTNGNVTVLINGLAATTANFPTLLSSVASDGGTSFNPATGVMDIAATAAEVVGSGVCLYNLPLGLYTVRMTTAGTGLNFEAVDIITPIHSPHTTFGSRSLKDLRNFDSKKDVNKKLENKENNLLVNIIEDIVVKSEGISQVLKPAGGTFFTYWDEPFVDEEFILLGTSDSDNTVNGGDPSITAGQNRTPSSVYAQVRIASTGTLESERRVNIVTKGKLQKDELEE